jgi:hypothetical protein
MRARLWYWVGGLMVVTACRPGNLNLAPVVSDARVFYDDGPAFRDSVRMVVRDSAAWQTVWTQATSTQASPPPLPAVNFARDMIVLVGAGRMTPGDQIHVDSVGVRGDAYVVVVRTTVQCRPFPAAVYPVEIVRVPQSDKPTAFAERRERANC